MQRMPVSHTVLLLLLLQVWEKEAQDFDQLRKGSQLHATATAPPSSMRPTASCSW